MLSTMSKAQQTSSNQDNKELPEEEQLDFNNPDYQFIPPAHHKWIQQGPYLVCRSCELQHAVPIGMKKVLMGFDDKGEPIIKSRSEVGL